MISLTLKLFNGVLSKSSDSTEPHLDSLGIAIEPSALWAKDSILVYYEQVVSDGHDLNKTFHKSWNKIKTSTRWELLQDQILHYMTTYGTDFESEFIYIPTENLDIPRIDINELKFKVIHGYTREQLIEKCFSLLNSGIALQEETLDNVLLLLHDYLDYSFTGNENIKNKEAIVKLAEVFNVLPNDPVEFLRYIVYRSTGSSLLIKDDNTIRSIKSCDFNPIPHFKKFGLKRLAEIFNRFKPLFLAFKNKGGRTINKISKLSKTYHKPMVSNPLNEVTSNKLTEDDLHWLDNATVYALFKALNACHTRLKGQDTFMYSIRNGKSWVESNDSSNKEVWSHNYHIIMSYLKGRFDLSEKTFFVPDNIDYAIPTSEKQFVGNIPMGSKLFGKRLAVGMYWENKWGARDLDLSGSLLNGTKVGWDARYSAGKGKLLYSGDITSAPNGAVEYLHVNKGFDETALVNINVFSGSEQSGYKIIIGEGDNIDNDYMMNPNKLLFEHKVESVQKQMTLGLLKPEKEKDRQSFILLNVGGGSKHVSSADSQVVKKANVALYQEYEYRLSFKDIVEKLGGVFVSKEEVDGNTIDLSVENLDKTTFINIFK